MHNIVWPQHLISSKISSSLQGKSNINSSGNLSPYPSLPQPLATTICFLSLCIHLFCCCLVTQLYLTLCDSMDCRTPDSTVHGFPRQKYWSGLPFPSPEHLPNTRIKHWDWLFSHSITYSDFSHTVTWTGTSLLFMTEKYSIICTDHILPWGMIFPQSVNT